MELTFSAAKLVLHRFPKQISQNILLVHVAVAVSSGTQCACLQLSEYIKLRQEVFYHYFSLKISFIHFFHCRFW